MRENSISEKVDDPSVHTRSSNVRRRVIMAFLVLLALIVLVVVAPLINLNRYQRRIAANISHSLGRPVHLEDVSLNILPIPGFTLKNFVVDESPEFGYEPVLKAGTVQVTLRASSLWRGHVEFSAISLTDPSVNIVRNAQGRFNIESILLQASHIDAAPTTQKAVGGLPRFPYIQATGGRINLKLGDEKTPFSLTEAAFALWLPNPQEWNVRLNARPMRTDTNVADTGVFRLDGSLHRAEHLTDLPIDLSGQWNNLPLGEASKLLTGRDVGWRGSVALKFRVLGTLGSSNIQTQIHVGSVRREDFVPPVPLDIDATCKAVGNDFLHSLGAIDCQAPVGNGTATFAGTLPQTTQPQQLFGRFALNNVDAEYLADLSRILSNRIDSQLRVAGKVSGGINLGSSPADQPASSAPQRLTSARLTFALPQEPIAIATDVVFDKDIAALSPKRRGKATMPSDAFRVTLLPTQLDLGGAAPALLEGHFDATGYVLHLHGNVLPQRLAEFAKALPQFGDGWQEWIEANQDATIPTHIDLTTQHTWFGRVATQTTTK